MYEITNLDTGETFEISNRQAIELFGRAEWREMVQGYAPNWVIVRIS